MKRYEYGFLTAINGTADLKFYINGDFHSHYKSTVVGVALGELSYGGWEIKSVQYHPNGDLMFFLQKEISNDD